MVSLILDTPPSVKWVFEGGISISFFDVLFMKKNMFYQADPLLFERAKYLRNHLTNAEMKLWGYLRARPMGYKFRRQHPIGIYIVDFYCHACKLVIEADGSIHNKQDVKEADHERQVSLENDGLQVIRFTNNDILNNTEHVIEQINIILTEFQFLL